MAVTVTLSEQLSERLQTHADEVHLSLDALVERLLADTLPVYKSNGFHLPEHPITEELDDPDASLARVIAQIKATPPNPAAIEQGDKVGDMTYLQYLLDNPPTDTLTVEEWEQYWPAFEQEMKELDRAQEIAEGRL